VATDQNGTSIARQKRMITFSLNSSVHKTRGCLRISRLKLLSTFTMHSVSSRRLSEEAASAQEHEPVKLVPVVLKRKSFLFAPSLVSARWKSKSNNAFAGDKRRVWTESSASNIDESRSDTPTVNSSERSQSFTDSIRSDIPQGSNPELKSCLKREESPLSSEAFEQINRSTSKLKKSLSFGSVSIHYHDRLLGDNPAVR
jgi:hypothetical protein